MFGQPHRHFDLTDSTNRVALDWEDASHGALVSADEQSAGRGRLGRSWSSPAGKGLYFSLILRSQGEANALAQISLVAALAVAQSLEGQTGLSFKIKWPNDVLCRGFKVGGLLCEGRDGRIVVGIGLNVTHERDDLPERPIFPASSLLLESGKQFQTSQLLPALLETLGAQFERLENGEWPQLKTEFVARLYGVGELVRAGQYLGLLKGIDDEGKLLVQTADGLQTVVAGDVTFV